MAKIKGYRKEIGESFFPYYFGKIKNVFKYIYNIFKNLFKPRDIITAPGSHIITAYPGGGKTLLANKIINMFESDKYFFYTNVDEFKQNNIKVIDLKEIFKDKKQVKRLAKRDENGRKLGGIIFDEINLNFNRRVNQSKDYNDLFIGLIEMVVTHRHQGIPRLYFLGQKLELQDGQLISLFKYQHDIIKKRSHYRYWKYYKDGAQLVPTKLFVMHKLKVIDETGEHFADYKREKYKVNWFDLESYNTLGLAGTYEKLPVYRGTNGTQQ